MEELYYEPEAMTRAPNYANRLKLKQLLACIGLKIGQPFHINYSKIKYRIMDDGIVYYLYFSKGKVDGWKASSQYGLFGLLHSALYGIGDIVCPLEEDYLTDKPYLFNTMHLIYEGMEDY